MRQLRRRCGCAWAAGGRVCLAAAAAAVTRLDVVKLYQQHFHPACPPLALTDTRTLQAAQMELAKVATDFRGLHSQRQELLGQWEGVLAVVRRRDDEILEAGERQHRGAQSPHLHVQPAQPGNCRMTHCCSRPIQARRRLLVLLRLRSSRLS